MSDTSAIPVRPAATVVLLREAAAQAEAPAVFFVRRHRKSTFMPNAYVFPGGRVDEADGASRLLKRLDGVDESRLLSRMDGLGDTRSALSHVVAAIRETFEEAGVLLASRDGVAVDARTEPDLWDRLDAWRDRLNANETTFVEMVEAEALRLDASGLTYFAHWITPTHERKRYDARFFVVAAPPGQRYQHDDQEVTASCWLTASDALASYHGGDDFFLAPPTWKILQDIRDFTSVNDVVGWGDEPAAVPPIMPETKMRDGAFNLELPRSERIVLANGHWTLETP